VPADCPGNPAVVLLLTKQFGQSGVAADETVWSIPRHDAIFRNLAII
jgi:hypothetical protein